MPGYCTKGRTDDSLLPSDQVLLLVGTVSNRLYPHHSGHNNITAFTCVLCCLLNLRAHYAASQYCCLVKAVLINSERSEVYRASVTYAELAETRNAEAIERYR